MPVTTTDPRPAIGFRFPARGQTATVTAHYLRSFVVITYRDGSEEVVEWEVSA